MLLLAERRQPGTYNIGAERFRTLRQDLTALIRHAGTSAKVVGTPERLVMATLGVLDRLHLTPLGPWHYRSYHKPFFFDLSQPMNDLSWAPAYSNEETFTESYDWFVANREKPGGEETRSTHRKSVRQGLLWFLKHIS